MSNFTDALHQGWEIYLLSWAAQIVRYRWRAAKSFDFILKFDLYLTTRKSDFSWLTIYVPAQHGSSLWTWAQFCCKM